MRTIDDVLKNKVNGLYYGNRVLLPFAAEIVKAVVEDKIIMDFGSESPEAEYTVTDDFTEIYFFEYENLSDFVSEFEIIKLVVIEKGKDIFDFNNHVKLALHLQEKHKILIEELDEDILFIE